MTAPDHPLPSSGGRFVREADGSLTPVPPEADEAPAKTQKGAKPAPKEA